jgi:succinate-acetate transporter protein
MANEPANFSSGTAGGARTAAPPSARQTALHDGARSDASGLPRVFLRPIGSPLTLGLSGLAIASLVESGRALGWIDKSQGHQVALILIAIPFVLQLVACVFAYLARDGAAGATLGVLSGTWLAVGLIQLVSSPTSRSGALGLVLLASGAMVALSSLAIALGKPLPGLVFALAGARFALDGIHQLGGVSTWQHVAGIVGLVVCGLSGYAVLAFEIEGQRHRPVLPTFRIGVGRAAVAGGAAEQVQSVANEAGVRQTT